MDVLGWHIYPPFNAHSATQVCCIGIQQNQFLFKTGHRPLIEKQAQQTNIYTHLLLASE